MSREGLDVGYVLYLLETNIGFTFLGECVTLEEKEIRLQIWEASEGKKELN